METTRLSLSIIIPVYNGERFVPQLMETLSSQGIFDPVCPMPIEVIIIDDGSTDGTADAIRSRAACLPNLSLISQPNRGQGSARALGLSHAHMDYVYFMDADDILTPGCLIPATGMLDRFKGEVLHFQHDTVREEALDAIHLSTLPFDDPSHYDIISGRDYIRRYDYYYADHALWTLIISRDFLNRHAISPDNGLLIGEDGLCKLQILLRCERLVDCDLIGIHYIYYDTSFFHSLDRQHITRYTVANNRAADLWLHEASALTSPADADIRNALAKAAETILFDYWFILLAWTPLSLKEVIAEIALQRREGVIPISHYTPTKDKKAHPIIYYFLYFALRHPSLLATLFRVRYFVKMCLTQGHRGRGDFLRL